MTRKAGVLLHVSSLPGPYGAGAIGDEAIRTLDWLQASGHRVWQILPLNPVDQHGCPYASPSGFAREPLLLCPKRLRDDGWIGDADLPAERPTADVDWPALRRERAQLLCTAADRVRADIDLSTYERGWRADWAIFSALREGLGCSWPLWPRPLRDRDQTALAEARGEHAAQVERALALQWLFDRQWARVRAAATERGIEIWGDMPFFVGLDSCDVWANQHLYQLDSSGHPLRVSGVPPDAFSPVGQLWGHPQYDPDAMRADEQSLWIRRIAAALDTVDMLRIDHFRGVAAVWSVPAGAEDARPGAWTEGPGRQLLDQLDRFRRADGSLPIIAEDLGVITPDVAALRDGYDLPGMAILQFAFGPPFNGSHVYLPANHRQNTVAYTGTHDNDTTLGWFRTAPPPIRRHALARLDARADQMPWPVLTAAWSSRARWAIVPAQDLLGLGSEARMNVPGVVQGNWSWRLPPNRLTGELADGIQHELRIHRR